MILAPGKAHVVGRRRLVAKPRLGLLIGAISFVTEETLVATVTAHEVSRVVRLTRRSSSVYSISILRWSAPCTARGSLVSPRNRPIRSCPRALSAPAHSEVRYPSGWRSARCSQYRQKQHTGIVITTDRNCLLRLRDTNAKELLIITNVIRLPLLCCHSGIGDRTGESCTRHTNRSPGARCFSISTDKVVVNAVAKCVAQQPR